MRPPILVVRHKKLYHTTMITIQTDCNLAPFLWYKIGGKAKHLLEIASKDDVLQAVEFVGQKNIKNILVVGLGSNLLFAEEYFDGAIFRFVPTQNVILVNEVHPGSDRDSGQALRQAQDAARMTGSPGLITSFAGEPLDSVIQFGFNNNLIGLEWAGGLPGTVGAAVRGNVGAFGGEIKDTVEEVEAIDIRNKEIKKLRNNDLEFAYRSSLIKRNKDLIVSSVTFKLKPATDKEVEKAREVYNNNIDYRSTNHPLDYPNCGSVFKNITDGQQVQKILEVYPDVADQINTKWHGKVSMAYLINRLGFSSFKIGQAEVSPKHANFIVNLGNAKAQDVLQIIEAIKFKFQKTFGFTPEVEVEIV